MKRLELESLLADREAVRALLASISNEDPVGRFTFESRLIEIEAQLKKLEQLQETRGSVALMFGGEPVLGSRAIDAQFASSALKTFQDLVTKRIATEEIGQLGARGRIPLRATTSLAITELVRGSVGFMLEESSPQQDLDNTAVKAAIDDVTDVIARSASENHEDFEKAVEKLDARLLVSLKEFFKTLDDGHATLRLVEEHRDETLDAPAVRRARERIEATSIEDDEKVVEGELLGLLPQGRKFEMRLAESGETIRGTVAPKLAQDWLPLIEGSDESLVGRNWKATMRIREIRERNAQPRRLYTLLRLLEKK